MKSNVSQRIVSGALIFWLSGLIFLFCCEMPMAKAAEEDESCPLAKINHCDKKTASENNSQSASFQSESRAFDCCILPNIFDKARKIEQNPQTAVIALTVKISTPEFSIVENRFDAPRLYRPPVLNRGGTYLKNRVFRI
jgi:hypothetical protein